MKDKEAFIVLVVVEPAPKGDTRSDTGKSSTGWTRSYDSAWESTFGHAKPATEDKPN